MNHCPDRSPMFQLVAALSTIQHRLDDALEPIGLSLAKFGVLAKLATADEPLPLRTLAERCACVRSNITQLVDRLESEGLVTRTVDPRDRRSVLAIMLVSGMIIGTFFTLFVVPAIYLLVARARVTVAAAAGVGAVAEPAGAAL